MKVFKESSSNIPDTKLFKIFFLTFFFGLAVLRTIDVGNVPNGVFYDEARLALHADCLLEDGKDGHGRSYPLFTLGGASGIHSPLTLYSQMVWQSIFGSDITSIRYFSVLISFLISFLLFNIAKNLFGTKTAVFVLFFDLISPWNFHFSRLAWDHNHGNLWNLLFFYLAIKMKRRRDYVICGVACGLMLYTYASSQFQSLGAILAVLAIRKIRGQDFLTYKFSFFSTFFLTAAPFFISLINGIQTSRYRALSLFSDIPDDYLAPFVAMLINYFRTLSVEYLLISGDGLGTAFGTTVFGNLNVIEFLGALTAILFMLYKLKLLIHLRYGDAPPLDVKAVLILILFCLILYSLIPSAICRTWVPNSMRTLSSAPFIHLVAGYGLYLVYKKSRAFSLVLVIAALFQYSLFLNYYFGTFRTLSKQGFLESHIKNFVTAKDRKELEKRMAYDKSYHLHGYLGVTTNLFSCKELREFGLKYEETSVTERLELIEKHNLY